MALIDLNDFPRTNRSINWAKQTFAPACYQILDDENGNRVIRFLSFREDDFNRTVNRQKQDMIFNIEELKNFLNTI
ncbi:MAG: hypothetical protein HY958_11350 [Bacteroidia bacterium]|nr:hypothetical protein [Bacteroidia bacterium]